MLSYVLLS
jgi:hypothetical protein